MYYTRGVSYTRIRIKFSIILPIAVLLLLLTFRIQSANAWQLGWTSTDPEGYYGIESEQQVDGGVPSADGLFWPLVGFYDYDNSYWTNIELRDGSDGSDVWVMGEVIAGGVDHQYTMCSSLSTGTSYTDQITWDSTNDGWLYQSSASSCNSWLVQEGDTSDKIEGSPSYGGYDFTETSDGTSNDFLYMNAYTWSSYTLHYEDSSGTWYTPQWIKPLNSGAPSDVGVYYICAYPSLEMGSDYAGPWSYSSTPSWACTP